MRNYSRNLLVVVKGGIPDHRAIRQEMDCLDGILSLLETDREFCLAHELVNRDHITTDPSKILRETKAPELRSFRFLINKN